MEYILLNITTELVAIEKIFAKYKDPQIDPNLKIFLPNLRFPPLINEGLPPKDSCLWCNQPQHPYLCVDFVANVILKHIYKNIKNKELFTRNEVLHLYNLNYENFLDYTRYTTNWEDLLNDYIPNIELPEVDFLIIENALDSIIGYVDDIIVNYPDDIIWRIDYYTSEFILVNHGEIGTYRYNEILRNLDVIEHIKKGAV